MFLEKISWETKIIDWIYVLVSRITGHMKMSELVFKLELEREAEVRSKIEDSSK